MGLPPSLIARRPRDAAGTHSVRWSRVARLPPRFSNEADSQTKSLARMLCPSRLQTGYAPLKGFLATPQRRTSTGSAEAISSKRPMSSVSTPSTLSPFCHADAVGPSPSGHAPCVRQRNTCRDRLNRGHGLSWTVATCRRSSWVDAIALQLSMRSPATVGPWQRCVNSHSRGAAWRGAQLSEASDLYTRSFDSADASDPHPSLVRDFWSAGRSAGLCIESGQAQLATGGGSGLRGRALAMP